MITTNLAYRQDLMERVKEFFSSQSSETIFIKIN
jgi:hypothetical protein